MYANMEGWTNREMERGEDQWWMWGWIDGSMGGVNGMANARPALTIVIRLFSIKRHNCLIDSKLFEIATGHWRSVSVPSRGCSYSQYIRVLLHFNCSLVIVSVFEGKATQVGILLHLFQEPTLLFLRPHQPIPRHRHLWFYDTCACVQKFRCAFYLQKRADLLQCLLGFENHVVAWHVQNRIFLSNPLTTFFQFHVCPHLFSQCVRGIYFLQVEWKSYHDVKQGHEYSAFMMTLWW